MLLDAFAKIMIPFQYVKGYPLPPLTQCSWCYYRHNLYYIVLSLARFNLYANSYIFLLGPKSKRDAFWAYEITGIVFYWAYYGSMLRHLPSWQMRLGYLLISHIMASPVHVQVSSLFRSMPTVPIPSLTFAQIVLSHFACSTEDLGPAESFPSRQLRTTMDVICDQNIEWIHGGLNLQVTHHLFPRLPRHNLRAASMLVKEYCKEHDIVYREHFFIEGWVNSLFQPKKSSSRRFE